MERKRCDTRAEIKPERGGAGKKGGRRKTRTSAQRSERVYADPSTHARAQERNSSYRSAFRDPIIHTERLRVGGWRSDIKKQAERGIHTQHRIRQSDTHTRIHSKESGGTDSVSSHTRIAKSRTSPTVSVHTHA
jgi:hypothetical protein